MLKGQMCSDCSRRDWSLMFILVKTDQNIHDNHIGTQTFRANAERIFVELVPALPLAATIADDGSGAGEPRRGQNLD
jgi:hypothetical protein